jgi:2'-5' RNA ligase
MNPKKNSSRVFVSVELPIELREKAALLADELPVDSIKPVKPESMHLTLKFIGEIPFDKLAEIEEKLRSVEFFPFDIELAGAGVFPNENYVRVIWIGVKSDQLNDLAAKVGEALAGIGKKESRGFSAHLTIARVKKKIDVSEFLLKHKNDEFGRVKVSKFYLMQSVLEFGKPPKYNVLAEFSSSVKES